VTQHPRTLAPACALTPQPFTRAPLCLTCAAVMSPRLQVQELTPPSPLVCLRYNFKTPDVLVGGCYNGLVCVFDVKKPRGIAIQVRLLLLLLVVLSLRLLQLLRTVAAGSPAAADCCCCWFSSSAQARVPPDSFADHLAARSVPARPAHSLVSSPLAACFPPICPCVCALDAPSVSQTSSIDRSHHDPVYDVFWIQSKTNNQFASVSTDGQMMWWDTRKLTEPTEVLQLNDGASAVQCACSAGCGLCCAVWAVLWCAGLSCEFKRTQLPRTPNCATHGCPPA